MKNTNSGIEVYATTDYTIFHLFKENRQVRQRRVKQLKDKIEKKNMLYLYPVVVTPDGFMLDGQHRLAAAEQLGVPIYYIIADEDVDITDIAMTNTATTRWTRADYLHHWAESGNAHYIMLREFWQKHEEWMSISTAAAITQGLSASSTLAENYRNKFNEGEYEVTDMRFAIRFARTIERCAEYFEYATERTFMAALSVILRDPIFDEDELIHKLSKWPGKLQRQPDKESYLLALEDLYNYHRHGPRVMFRR